MTLENCTLPELKLLLASTKTVLAAGVRQSLGPPKYSKLTVKKFHGPLD